MIIKLIIFLQHMVMETSLSLKLQCRILLPKESGIRSKIIFPTFLILSQDPPTVSLSFKNSRIPNPQELANTTRTPVFPPEWIQSSQMGLRKENTRCLSWIQEIRFVNKWKLWVLIKEAMVMVPWKLKTWEHLLTMRDHRYYHLFKKKPEEKGNAYIYLRTRVMHIQKSPRKGEYWFIIITPLTLFIF